jgi:peptidyl-tRNA hydrolase
MKLIVGQGNYGPEYEKTRHNYGFMVVDELQKKHNFPDLSWKGASGPFPKGDVILAKPHLHE